MRHNQEQSDAIRSMHHLVQSDHAADEGGGLGRIWPHAQREPVACAVGARRRRSERSRERGDGVGGGRGECEARLVPHDRARDCSSRPEVQRLRR